MAEPEATHDVRDAVKRFEEAEEATATARVDAERDRDYYDGKQWTDEEKAALTARGQPVVTFNRIQRKVNYLKGLEAQTRKDPKAFPRTPGDEGSSQAATDALRFVCDDQLWDTKRSEAFESVIVEGTGAIFVGVAEGKQGPDPSLMHIAWDRLYHDPYSCRPDFSDAAYMGIVTWKDMVDVERQFPDAGEAIEQTWKNSQHTNTYDDRPKHQMWADYKRKRIRVCEEYYREDGQWMVATFTQGGYLKEPEPSPYLDEDGKPECPINAVSAYVDRDNNRYGEVRAMISPQDEVNKRRSKGLHLINSRQVRVSKVASVGTGNMDPTAIKKELAKPDGIIFGEAGEVEVLNTTDMAAANLEMLQEAKAEIDLLGPNAALAGKNENDQSGRALLAQQQGGMVEVALLMDRLRGLSLSVYRAIWARIRQYWTDQRWIRVTDDERNLRFVGLNQPQTMGDLLQAAMEGDQESVKLLGRQYPQVLHAMQAAAQGDQEAAVKLQLAMQHPMMQQPLRVKNAVAEMDIDIIIDEGMDTPTIQAEQFETLSKTLPGIVQLPPQYAKMLIMASSLRDKDKMLEMMEEMEQGGNPLEAQMQAEQAKLEMEMQVEAAKLQQQGQLQREKHQMDAELKREGAQIDAEVEIAKAKIKAEADAKIKADQIEADSIVEDRKNQIEAKRDSEANAHKQAETAKSDSHAKQLELLTEMMAHLAKPRKRVPIRDKDGLIVELREEMGD